MALTLVSAPAVEPLTAAEAKARLNIGDEVSDPVVSALITAARLMFDGSSAAYGRALITQTWDLTLDRFDCYPGRPLETGFHPGVLDSYWSQYRSSNRGIVIPLSPLQSVTSIKYLDTDSAEQTLDPSNYLVQKGEPSRIVLSTTGSWPSTAAVPNAVTVRFVAGYGDAGADVPETARMAIALQVSHLRSLAQRNLFVNHEEIPGVRSVGYTVGGGAGQAIGDAAKALMEGLRVLG